MSKYFALLVGGTMVYAMYSGSSDMPGPNAHKEKQLLTTLPKKGDHSVQEIDWSDQNLSQREVEVLFLGLSRRAETWPNLKKISAPFFTPEDFYCTRDPISLKDPSLLKKDFVPLLKDSMDIKEVDVEGRTVTFILNHPNSPDPAMDHLFLVDLGKGLFSLLTSHPNLIVETHTAEQKEVFMRSLDSFFRFSQDPLNMETIKPRILIREITG